MRTSFLKIIFYVFITLGTLLQTACSNPFGGSQSEVQVGHNPGAEDANPTPTPTPHPLVAAKGVEFVSSSAQGVSTVGHRFIVYGSLASPGSEILGTTANLHYKVFSNVQGEIISEGDGL